MQEDAGLPPDPCGRGSVNAGDRPSLAVGSNIRLWLLPASFVHRRFRHRDRELGVGLGRGLGGGTRCGLGRGLGRGGSGYAPLFLPSAWVSAIRLASARHRVTEGELTLVVHISPIHTPNQSLELRASGSGTHAVAQAHAQGAVRWTVVSSGVLVVAPFAVTAARARRRQRNPERWRRLEIHGPMPPYSHTTRA